MGSEVHGTGDGTGGHVGTGWLSRRMKASPGAMLGSKSGQDQLPLLSILLLKGHAQLCASNINEGGHG